MKEVYLVSGRVYDSQYKSRVAFSRKEAVDVAVRQIATLEAEVKKRYPDDANLLNDAKRASVLHPSDKETVSKFIEKPLEPGQSIALNPGLASRYFSNIAAITRLLTDEDPEY